MNKKAGLMLTVIIGIVALVAGFIAGTNFVTPQLGPTDPSVSIRANSCDRDDTCEVGSYGILSPYALHLTSQADAVKIEGDLTLAKIGNQGGVMFKTTESGSLTIAPQSGATKLESILTLTGAGYQGGVVLKSNEVGSLTVTPQSGAAKIEGYLSITNLTGSGNAYACVDSGGRIYRSLTACR